MLLAMVSAGVMRRRNTGHIKPLRALEPLGVFARTFSAIAAEAGEPDTLMIDATHLIPARAD